MSAQRQAVRAIPLMRTDARVAGAPNVMVDDEIYAHNGDGPIAGRVVSVGADGCMIEHPEQGNVPVEWQHFLGHKRRVHRDVAIVDQGEDGAIGVDQHGKHVYIRGEIPFADAESDVERHGQPLKKAEDAVTPLLAAAATDLTPVAAALGEMAKAWGQYLHRQAEREESADIRREALDAMLVKAQAEVARAFGGALADLLKAHEQEFLRLHGELAALHGMVAARELSQDPAPATGDASKA